VCVCESERWGENGLLKNKLLSLLRKDKRKRGGVRGSD